MARQSFDYDWEFTERFEETLCGASVPAGKLESIDLPHSNTKMPYHYFPVSCYQMVCGYRKLFFAENTWKGRRVFLTFEGVAHAAEVYLNAQKIEEHQGGYTSFCVELTKQLLYGEKNVLAVKVDSRESLDIPPFGNVIDYMTYGGIYRSVILEVKETVYIQDVYIQTPEVLPEKKKIDVQITVNEEAEHLTVRQSILDGTNRIHVQEAPVTGLVTKMTAELLPVRLWDIEDPKLYSLLTVLYKDGKELDRKETVFGFRTCEFRKDGFYLNEKRIKIRGLNRHQCYPYCGYAMPKAMQEEDARILKEELAVNAVRTSHYPQDQSFYDACDRLGLLVFTELPGWQHIGGEAWKETACASVREMVLQNRNHPSVILWGVRINESQDDDEFYKKTNQIAHQLDPSRQTSGVRFFHKSSLLEDVYAYNDFSHTGDNPGVEEKKEVTPDPDQAYLISEYNGHMFPTKAFDDEGHRLAHALRHARV
ncbi:MAG TPA: glycoside hydrolase family 2 TIM barrel-domain containing protein, partial [Lachnospiraceae bacterium]|nr:glycoside hydrolase family 2 TIM barrel-domain containing protein [Lachnospiraceae bacterium]